MSSFKSKFKFEIEINHVIETKLVYSFTLNVIKSYSKGQIGYLMGREGRVTFHCSRYQKGDLMFLPRPELVFEPLLLLFLFLTKTKSNRKFTSFGCIRPIPQILRTKNFYLPIPCLFLY